MPREARVREREKEEERKKDNDGKREGGSVEEKNYSLPFRGRSKLFLVIVFFSGTH